MAERPENHMGERGHIRSDGGGRVTLVIGEMDQ